MVDAVDRIPVPFDGLTADQADLTWGQQEIWSAMVAQQSWLPIFFVNPVPSGTTVADVVAEVRYCLRRYESMRTRLSFATTGTPRQVVSGTGEVTLEVVEAGDADPAESAAAVRDRFVNAPFDHVRDWPVRTAVVLRHGTPVLLVRVYCHLVLDAFGNALLRKELAERDPAPSAAMQPVQLARWERTEPARRASDTSLAYWERWLRGIPARRFRQPGEARRPRYWQAVFRSRALYLALRLIAARTQAGSAPLLTVFAVAFARVTGGNPVVAQVVVSNRFRAHLAGVLAPVNQTGLWVVDLAGLTFADALRLARRRAMSTFKHAYYDPAARADLIARVGRERGTELDVACLVNDRRMEAAAPAGGPVADLAGIRAARSDTTFTWQTRTDIPNERFFLHVDDAPDAVVLTAWADTHHLAPDDLAAIVHEMESVAVAAAADPDVPTGIGAAARPARTVGS